MSERHSKPAKPERPDGSPLFWHATGRWAKKIRGKLHYFGRGSHDDGLAEYERVAADLHAGRKPADEREGFTVLNLCTKFLTAKKDQRDNGELSPSSFCDYADLCKRILKAFGRGRLVSDLRPDDFAELRKSMAKRWGVVRLKVEIVRTRTPFLWGFKNGLIDRPVLFGESFKVPTAKTLRAAKNAAGPKMFEADEIRGMLAAAGPGLKAMILLGINAAYGNSDVARLPIDAIDLDGGWVTFARSKTGIGRRTPLWPETVAAIREWLAVRPEPKEAEDAGVTFVTSKLGSWLDVGNKRSLSHEFRRLLDECGIDGRRGFYGLRHTLQTVGDESGDFVAVRSVMGHAGGNDIGNVYRERTMTDARLLKVTDHVRGWLFPVPADGEGAEPQNDRPRFRVVG